MARVGGMLSFEEFIRKLQRDGFFVPGYGMGAELEAMGAYNEARRLNLFGSYKNAFDQSARKRVTPPAHMMPGFMEWLAQNQPRSYEFLYGPLPKSEPPKQRTRDTRTREERRAPQPYSWAAPPKQAPPPPNQAPPPPKQAPPPPKPPPPPTPPQDDCAAVKALCKPGESGKKCYVRLNLKGEYRHPDKGGDTAKNQKLQGCRDKL